MAIPETYTLCVHDERDDPDKTTAKLWLTSTGDEDDTFRLWDEGRTIAIAAVVIHRDNRPMATRANVDLKSWIEAPKGKADMAFTKPFVIVTLTDVADKAAVFETITPLFPDIAFHELGESQAKATANA